MELGPRDRLSQAFVKEDQKGRTVKTEYGSVVHLDLRQLGEKLINAKLPFVRELCMKYENIDPVKELIPVRPVVHYMMGGVSTDINGATPLGGLFAAGEAAGILHRRRPSGVNSLTECLVLGAGGPGGGRVCRRERDSERPGPGAGYRRAKRLEHGICTRLAARAHRDAAR
jgi:fumarate reductase flavoprotein subunit